MHIALLADALATGGKERQLIELIKGLIQYTDIKISLVTFSEVNEFEDLHLLKIDIIPIRRNHRFSLKPFSDLYHFFKREKPDVIHSWNIMCSVYALPLAKYFHIKFINGIIRDAPAKLKRFTSRNLIRKITFRFSDIILSNSTAGLQAYNIASDKGKIIYNGFDLSRIQRTENMSLIKQDFRITTTFVIIMVARFSAQKDYPTYIEAAKSIIDQRSDVTFLAVGDGPELTGIKKSINPPYSDYFRFTGQQSDVERLIYISDIGVLTTYTEGISNVLLEYMAFQKPIIVTRGGGTIEIVIDGRTGFIIGQKDIKNLIDKINYLLNNQNDAIRMGQKGFERLQSDFSLLKMTSAHYDLYKSCTGLS